MGELGSMVKHHVVSQPVASVMVTHQSPAHNPLTEAVPAPTGGAGDQA